MIKFKHLVSNNGVTKLDIHDCIDSFVCLKCLGIPYSDLNNDVFFPNLLWLA